MYVYEPLPKRKPERSVRRCHPAMNTIPDLVIDLTQHSIKSRVKTVSINNLEIYRRSHELNWYYKLDSADFSRLSKFPDIIKSNVTSSRRRH